MTHKVSETFRGKCTINNLLLYFHPPNGWHPCQPLRWTSWTKWISWELVVIYFLLLVSGSPWRESQENISSFTTSLQAGKYPNLVLTALSMFSGLFVVISSMSFLIPPSAYPARFGLLVTSLLVLVNMFNSVLTSTPSGSKVLKSHQISL